MTTQTKDINMISGGVRSYVNVSQYDVGSEINFALYNNSSAFTPPAGTTVRVEGRKPDGNGFSYSASLSDNVVTVTVTDQMTVLSGEVLCELRLTKDSVDIGTANFILAVEEAPINSDIPISDTEIPAIIELARQEQYTAEAWAVGTRNGTSVSSDDPTYNNNAKYYSDNAQSITQGLVTGLAAEVNARSSADSNLQSQINQIVAPSGEAPSAAEVENARVGADGVTYSALGDAIRNQVSSIFKSKLAISYSDLTRDGFVNNSGVFTAYNGYKTTPMIPCRAEKVTFIGSYIASVAADYFNLWAYDENQNPISGVMNVPSSTSTQELSVNLPNETYYITFTTATSASNKFYLIRSIDDMLPFIKAELLADAKYSANTFTTCNSTSGLAIVADNYGIAITNRINKGSIIKKIKFINSNISNSNAHYIIYVSCNGYVLKKWFISGQKIDLNYVAEESGYLCYCRTNSGSINGMFYKYNVASETDPNKTKVNSYIFSTSGGINVGSKLNPISYTNNSKNFVGCIIEGYIINNDNSYNTKYAAFLGDSITAGLTWNGSEQVYVQRPFPRTVQSKIGLDIQMKGYSSYPISSTGKSDCLLAVYNTIDTNVDYIIVFAGTNDLYYNVPIGTIADTTDISFYGAVNTLINGLATNYPNAQIVFMTPIHRSWEGANNAGAKLEDYVNAMKDVCKLCGIPVIDLYSQSYFSWAVTKFHDYYSDGLHPTQDGYDLLGNVVAKYLENVLI